MLTRIIINNNCMSSRKFKIAGVVNVFSLGSGGLEDSRQHFSAFNENGEWRNTLVHTLEKFLVSIKL